MTDTETLICSGLSAAVGYAAGRLRPLDRLDDALKWATHWARYQLDWPRPPAGPVIVWAAHTVVAAVVLVDFLAAPVATFRNMRRVLAAHAYTRHLPNAVIQAAATAVEVHLPEKAEHFHALVLPVYPTGPDLSNVIVLSKHVPREYIGLGSAGNATAEPEETETRVLAAQALTDAVTALAPPVGLLTIPLQERRRLAA